MDVIEKHNQQSFEWYYDERYLMRKQFIDKHEYITFYHVDINDLNNLKKVYQMLDYFKINPLSSLITIINKQVD